MSWRGVNIKQSEKAKMRERLIREGNENLENFRRMTAAMEMNLATADLSRRLRQNLKEIKDRLVGATAEEGFPGSFMGWDQNVADIGDKLAKLEVDIREYNTFQITELLKEARSLIHTLNETGAGKSAEQDEKVRRGPAGRQEPGGRNIKTHL